ncbi:lipid II flippase MurJ, partial [Streptomyces goshikiensis]
MAGATSHEDLAPSPLLQSRHTQAPLLEDDGHLPASAGDHPHDGDSGQSQGWFTTAETGPGTLPTERIDDSDPRCLLAKAAAVTAGLTAAGALFGLVRDQTIAHLFGAGHDSDSFLIAWTVPEMASTLLIEDAMALLMVPAFSHALARRAAGRAGLTRKEARTQDPVRLLVGATLPRLVVLLAAVACVLVVAAPLVVGVLAPGLPDPRLAVECTRMTALTVLSFGIAGYFSAALRAHRSFLPPAAIYVSYNIGIIAVMVALHTVWGVRAGGAPGGAGGVVGVGGEIQARRDDNSVGGL